MAPYPLEFFPGSFRAVAQVTHDQQVIHQGQTAYFLIAATLQLAQRIKDRTIHGSGVKRTEYRIPTQRCTGAMAEIPLDSKF